MKELHLDQGGSNATHHSAAPAQANTKLRESTGCEVLLEAAKHPVRCIGRVTSVYRREKDVADCGVRGTTAAMPLVSIVHVRLEIRLGKKCESGKQGQFSFDV